MPVPYIPIPSLRGTALNMPTPTAGALAAPAAALGQVARGIADMGGALGQHAERVQGLENAYQESEVRQRISADMAELNQQLANNSDPASYMPLLEKSLAKQKTYLDDQSLSPIVREKLAFHFEVISSDARIRTGAAAAGMTAKRAQLAINNELEAAATYGNREAYTQAVTRGVDAGIILPEQADTLNTNFEQRATYDTLVKAIEADPMGASEQLNSETISEQYPHLTPENHERLKKYAVQQSNNAKAESWEQIVLSSMDGAVLSKDDVLQMAKDGDISPAQAASYINTYLGPTPPAFDPIIFDDAHKAIASYDPAKDETGAIRAQMAAQIATLPLPPESIRELTKQFKAKQDSSSDTPETNKDLRTEFNSRLETEWDSEAFGNWFDYDSADFTTPAGEKKSFTHKVISQKDFVTALAFKLKTQRAFNAWLSQQPDGLDPLEAEKKYNEIKGKALDGISMPDLAPTLAPMPTFDDVDEYTNPDGSPSVLPTSDTTESRTNLDGTQSTPLPPAPTDTTTSRIGTFGGQPIQPAGRFYKNAATSVFGGNTDPADNGLSANGGSNNAFPGVAIPEKMLKATFPGKSKQWFFDNVKIVVEADNGRKITVPLVDYGTAEWVTQREGRHKLDLNPKAVAALGGQLIYKNGVLKAHSGFTNVNFALTTAKAGKLDPKTSSIDEMKAEWFKDKRPRHPEQIRSGLSALYDEFYRNQLPADA